MSTEICSIDSANGSRIPRDENGTTFLPNHFRESLRWHLLPPEDGCQLKGEKYLVKTAQFDGFLAHYPITYEYDLSSLPETRRHHHLWNPLLTLTMGFHFRQVWTKDACAIWQNESAQINESKWNRRNEMVEFMKGRYGN